MRSGMSYYRKLTAVVCATISALLLAACGSGGSIFGTNGSGSGGSSTQNPVPNITSISPSTVNAGSAAQTLTINGSNFLSSSTATFNGVAHTVAFISGNKISISLSASDQAVGGTYPVVVTNPTPGGGSSAAVNLTVDNPGPVISSISPTSVDVGVTSATLTINGSNFLPSTTVSLGGKQRAATIVSGTQITLSLNSADTAAAGTLSIDVSNPTPLGGDATASLSINNPAVTLTAISPATTVLGATPAVTSLTLTGSGFVPGATTVSLGGAAVTPTTLTATSITIPITVDQVFSGAANAGNLAISIANAAPADSPSSAAMNFIVDNPLPTITTVTPTSVALGSGAANITVTGTGFVAGSQVQFNGSATGVTTTPPTTTAAAPTATSLTATIAASDITAAGSFTVGVVNPAPVASGSAGGGTLTVTNPVPAIVSMLPSSAGVGVTEAVTLAVSGYIPGVTSVTFAGASVGAVTAVQDPSNPANEDLAFTLTAADVANIGPKAVTVANAAPGGGSSTRFFLVGGATATAGGVAVLAQEVNGQTVDVAYIPMVPVPGGPGEVDVVQLDTLDPQPFLPINGFVTDTMPYYVPDTTGFVVGHQYTCGGVTSCVQVPVLKRIVLPGFVPTFTAGDPANQQVLVGSTNSNHLYLISTKVNAPSQTAALAPYTVGSGTAVQFSDDDNCVICAIAVDQTGTVGKAGAVAVTGNGYIRFNTVTGAVLQSFPLPPAANGAFPAEAFGYNALGSEWNLLSGYYTPTGSSGAQFLDFTSGTVAQLKNYVGTRPDSAVVDPLTQIGLIADEGTGTDTLLNLLNSPSPLPASLNLPSTSFTIGSGGVFCQYRPDYTLASLDPNTHLLFAGQEFQNCLSVTQLPTQPVTDSSGNPIAPPSPATPVFGSLTAPQGPYKAAYPWTTVDPDTGFRFDPDESAWANSGDPHKYALYTSVLTGRPMALMVEGPHDLPGCGAGSAQAGSWLALTDLTSLAGAPVSSAGEVDPKDMIGTTTFLRTLVPQPVLCSLSPASISSPVTNDVKITLTGSGFVTTSNVTFNGIPVTINSVTPTTIDITVSAGLMPADGSYAIQVSTYVPAGSTDNAVPPTGSLFFSVVPPAKPAR
jgi:hypothetical protein